MSTVENLVSTFPTRRLPQQPWLSGLCLAAADGATIFVAITLSLVVCNIWSHKSAVLADALAPAASVLLVFGALGLYTVVGLSPVQEFQRVLAGSTIGYGVAAAASVLWNPRPVFVAVLAGTWLATILLVPVCREILRRACYDRPWWGTPTVIFGSGNSVRLILNAVRRQPSLGIKVVAVFDNNHPDRTDFDERQIHAGTLHSATAFVETYGIDHAVIAISNTDANEMDKVIKKNARAFKSLLVIPEVAGISSVWVKPRDLGGVLALHVRQNLMHRNPRLFKRLFDIVFTSLLLILLSPVFAVIYVLIRLTSPGPVFYTQARIGLGNSTFTALKFRTMLTNADEVLPFHLEQNPALRSEWERYEKLKNDPRITSIGRFLRKTSLDELPQLWNVIRGDMSLVGPRPVPVREIVRYSEGFEEAFESYKSVRPGITGMWQVSGRNNTTFSERVEFDEYYVRNWSIWLDVYILARTCKTVLFGEGAY